MAFHTFTIQHAPAVPTASVPKPPAAPRKRCRVDSNNKPRRVVRSKKCATPGVPLKSADAAWTTEEMEALRASVMQYGERKRDWPKVGRAMAHLGRDKEACRKQWLRMRPPVKGSWTEEEDALLSKIVTRQGATGWSSIAKHIAGRNAKQCRERWVNHLNPNVNKASWTEEEDAKLMKAHNELGNKWSEIAKRLTGRPDNAVKNRYYTLLNRANGGGRKRQRAARRVAKATAATTAEVATPAPASGDGAASLHALAEVAKVDLDAVDDDTKATLKSLANQFAELAAKAGASRMAPPPSHRRPSFHRRSVLQAAARAGGPMPISASDVLTSIEDSCDSLDFSRVSMASDALRDAAMNMSIDMEHSVGLESASFASDLLTALDASLDLSNIDIAALAKLDVPRAAAAATLSPVSEGRASAGTASPVTSPIPAPPTQPCQRAGRRPARTTSMRRACSPVALPPADMEALPLEELSINSLSLSLADLSFLEADAAAAAVDATPVTTVNANDNLIVAL